MTANGTRMTSSTNSSIRSGPGNYVPIFLGGLRGLFLGVTTTRNSSAAKIVRNIGIATKISEGDTAFWIGRLLDLQPTQDQILEAHKRTSKIPLQQRRLSKTLLRNELSTEQLLTALRQERVHVWRVWTDPKVERFIADRVLQVLSTFSLDQGIEAIQALELAPEWRNVAFGHLGARDLTYDETIKLLEASTYKDSGRSTCPHSTQTRLLENLPQGSLDSTQSARLAKLINDFTAASAQLSRLSVSSTRRTTPRSDSSRSR
jgi:hypothetical protein